MLVQGALSETQHEAVVHILESQQPAIEAYVQLKAELTCIHQKSE